MVWFRLVKLLQREGLYNRVSALFYVIQGGDTGGPDVQIGFMGAVVCNDEDGRGQPITFIPSINIVCISVVLKHKT